MSQLGEDTPIAPSRRSTGSFHPPMSPVEEDHSINPSVATSPSGATLSSNPSTKNMGFLLLLTFLSAIGGFLFGYDTGVISGAMLYLRDYYQLNSFWQELVVAATIGSAAVFSMVSILLNNLLGRRVVILLASAVFTIGAVTMGASMSKGILLIGRIVVGVGIGLASMTVPVYIAEVSPAHLRGKLVTMNNAFITGGQFAASLMDGAFSNVPDGWRYMLGLAGLPSCLQLVCFTCLPESPRWLVSRGRPAAARKVLERIRGVGEATDAELEEIVSKHHEEEGFRQERGPRPILIQLFSQSWTRRALLIGCGLQAFQQLAGINTVMYYSASIIKMSGIRDNATAVWLSAATASVNFVFTFVGFCLIERLGRRHLLIGSLIGIFVSLILLAVGFQIAALQTPHVSFKVSQNNSALCLSQNDCDSCISAKSCGFCYTSLPSSGQSANGTCVAQFHDKALAGPCLQPSKDWFLAYDYCPTQIGWLILLSLILYLAFFAPGMGPVPWIINSEIYPLWGRSAATGLSTAVNWTLNLAVSLSFLTLTEALTKQGAFWLYSGLALMAMLFVVKFVPETKGKTLEQIEVMLQQEADSH